MDTRNHFDFHHENWREREKKGYNTNAFDLYPDALLSFSQHSQPVCMFKQEQPSECYARRWETAA